MAAPSTSPSGEARKTPTPQSDPESAAEYVKRAATLTETTQGLYTAIGESAV